MPKVVVITGAAGNLGGKLRAHLTALGGYELRLLDLRPGGDPEILQADLSVDDGHWSQCFAGAEVVVHLAANPQATAAWGALVAPNVDAVLNVYLAAARFATARVVLASSVWAAAGRRGDRGPILASDPNPGGNPYGATKLFAERVAHAFWRSHGVSTAALRLGGCRPGQNKPVLLSNSWENQCWLSNRDACQGLQLAIDMPLSGVLVANLTSDNLGSRWSLAEAREGLGFHPEDGLNAKSQTSRPSLAQKIKRRLGLSGHAQTETFEI